MVEKKKYRSILFAAAVLCLLGICEGCMGKSNLTSNVTASASINTEGKNMAVVIRDKELDLIDLKSNGSIFKLDNGGMFSHPIISPNKNYAAYLKDNTLYVSEINGQKSKVFENTSTMPYTLSYIWLDNSNLLYSPKSGGIFIFNADKAESKPYVINEFHYHNMTIGTDRKVYAEKYLYYEKDDRESIEDFGVVEFTSDTKKEQVIIKSIPIDKETFGMYPVIAGISKDFRFLLILEHPHSGSLAADGVGIAAYDTKSNKYMEFLNKGILTLGYKDNFSFCRKNSEVLALVNGGGREMDLNKTLCVLNIINGTLERLSPQGQVVMTPYYSSDCKNILYAASEKADGIEDLHKFMQGKHHIYSMNTETRQITQLTNSSTGFDFAPMYINDKDIVFLRSTSNNDLSISMWKLENGKETKLIDNLIFYNDENKTQDYYGHFYSNDYIDIK